MPQKDIACSLSAAPGSSTLGVWSKNARAMSHMLERIKSGGGAGYFLSGAGLIACKDVGGLEAFSGLWPPSPTFYTLREIERRVLQTSMQNQFEHVFSPIRELRRQGGSTSG